MSTNPEAASTGADAAMNRYKRDLALFRTLLATVNSSLELKQVLNLAMRTMLDVVGPGYAGLVLLVDRQAQGLQVAAYHGLSAGKTPRRVFAEECQCSQVLETGMPVFEPECSGPHCYVGFPRERKHSHLSFPLIARHSVIGLVDLFCPPDFQVDILDLSLWEDVGKLIGWAVEDAHLSAQLQQQRDLLQALYAVSDHLATSLDLEYVLSRVLDLSIAATEAYDGSIFLLPSAGAAAPHILRRDLTASEAGLVIDQVVGQGLAGWVVRQKLGAIVADTSQDPRWLSFSDEENPPGSVLAVPLMANDQVLGVLTLDHQDKAHFGDRHLVLMTAVAHQASAAIEKARLYKEISHLAGVLEQRVEERTRELRETQAQLVHAEKLAALGELAAGVAHEINNPLHILQAYMDYMASQAAADDPIHEMLEPMHNSLDSIAHLTSQLRDFSRPAVGERKPLSLNEALSKVLRLAGKELMHSRIRVEESFQADLPLVLGDPRQLEQVFLNLILNARDAMPGGGHLQIETCANGDIVCARFTDSGMGIAAEDLGRIFEPYFTTKEDRGTGLGLAICQRIVTQHGGKITVISKLGQGAQFTVQLPMTSEMPA